MKSLTELWDALQPILGLLGKALGVVAGILVGVLIAALIVVVGTLKLFVEVTTFAVEATTTFIDVLITAAKWLGIVSENTETYAEQKARLTAEAEKQAAAEEKAAMAASSNAKTLLADFDKRHDGANKLLGIDTKQVELYEKKATWTAKEYELMGKLLQEHAYDSEASANAWGYEDERAQKLRESLQYMKEGTAEYKKTEAAMKESEATAKGLMDLQVRILKDKEKGIDIEELDAKGTLEGAMAAKEKLEIREKAKKAEEAWKETIKEVNAIEKELRKVDKESITAQLNGLQELKDKRQETIDQAITEQEAIRARNVLTGKTVDVIDKEIAKLRELKDAINADMLKERAKILKKQDEDIAKELVDAQIKDAKLRGKAVLEANLENQKTEAEQKKKNDKLFELTGDPERDAELIKERGEVEAAEDRARQDRLRKGYEEETKKLGLNKTAEGRAKTEEDVTQQLVKQVKTIQDMFVLYQALAMLREQQDQRAMNTARAEFAAKERLAALEERRARTHDPNEQARLDKQIEWQKKVVQLAGGAAGREAEIAKIDDPTDLRGTGRSKTMMEKAEEAKKMVVDVKIGVETTIDAVTEVFRSAPVTWVTAFIDSWRLEGPKMLGVVNSSLAGFRGILGGGGLGGTAPAITPNFGNVLPSTGGNMNVDLGGGGEGGGGKTVNDNRHVEININSTVDLEEVRRVIGDALSEAGIEAGGI